MTRDPAIDDGFEDEVQLMPGVYLSKRKTVAEDPVADLDPAALQEEHYRLSLSLRQLLYSNQEIRNYLNPVDGRSKDETDEAELLDAIAENEQIIAKTMVKLQALEKKLLDFGIVLEPTSVDKPSTTIPSITSAHDGILDDNGGVNL